MKPSLSAFSHWLSLDWPSDGSATAPRAVISLATLGDMAVKPEPSQRVRAEIEKIFQHKRFIWPGQEHTRIVLSADPGEATSGTVGDGLVTHDPDTLLGVTVADCMPIFLWDEATGAKALCHSGWKGTGIARQAVRMMQERYGSSPKTIRAILGPSIRSCCYAVPKERAESFAAEFGTEAAFSRGGNWYLDLAVANKNILLDEGIQAIQIQSECTCCDTRFSSYRREGSVTHMLALCGL